MVGSPATPKHSKWSYLRARPRMGKKPAERSFFLDWGDTPPYVLVKAQRSSDAVSPSFSSTSGSKDGGINYTPKVMRSLHESELDEDPIPPSVRKLMLKSSSAKALSAQPLSNLPPSEPSELLKDLHIDSECSTREASSECSTKTLPVERPLLNIISEPQAPESIHLPVKEVSTSFGKKKLGKLDFEAGTIGAAVPTCQGQHQAVSMNRSAAIHGAEKSALKKSKSRCSGMQNVELPESSQPGNEQLALGEEHMPDVTYMPYSCTSVAPEIQIKERMQYTSESQATKCRSSGSRQGVVAKKRMSDSSVFVPGDHSTPLPSVRHIISTGSSSIPVELSFGLARRRTTATQWKTQPAFWATKNAQMSRISRGTAAECKQHSRASEHSFTELTQLRTCQDIDENSETSPGDACEIALVKQSCLSKHNRSQAPTEDKKATERSPKQRRVSFKDQRKHLEQTFINNDVQSEEASPVIPKLQECGRTRNGRKHARLITDSPVIPKLQERTRAKKPEMDTHDVWVQVDLCDQPSGLSASNDKEVQSEEASPVIPKLQKCGPTRNGKRDAQLITESPVIPKLQERTRAKKPKMDTHDVQLSPSVATVQKHAQRKKRKRPKVWVQVLLYDQPSGLRTKNDVTMYDIYLSLALEIIEDNRQQCRSKKGKKVMDQFYKEVAKDAIGIIDELQLYTNELVELQQEIMKMMYLRKTLDRISRGLGKYVRENNIRNVDPYQFYFEDEEEEYYV